MIDTAAIAEAWQRGLETWGVRAVLSPPEPHRKQPWDTDEPLAFIDLSTRQVVVNLELLEELGLQYCLPAVLAHEIGHHVRFPHTLALAAELAVLEKELLPALPSSLTNLFFDLQVNEVVGRDAELREGLLAVYRGFQRRAKRDPDPLFSFYLAIYEALWGRREGSLLRVEHAARLEHDYPGFRAESRVFASTFYSLDDSLLAFVYCCSRFARYLPEPGTTREQQGHPLAGDVPAPSAGDLIDALRSRARARDALHEAERRGWIGDGTTPKASEAGQRDVFGTLDRVLAGHPGNAGGAIRKSVVEGLYRALAERHLIEIPPEGERAPEPTLPTTLEPWEPGDSTHSIDWTASILASGVLAAAVPLRRELEPDGEPESVREAPAVEIYLDTSGSMPSPLHGLNTMSLAAVVLAKSALRAGGKVRGVVYSGNHEVSPWLYGEEAAQQFLLRYIGGGTLFPFDEALELARETPRALRVVISDNDFLANVRADGAMPRLCETIERSRRVALLLAVYGMPEADVRTVLGPALRAGAHLALVTNAADLPSAASALARALFE